MWLDKKNMFSEDQAITGSASDVITSTNVIDLTDTNVGEGQPVEFFANVTTAITATVTTTATSTIQLKVLTSANENMSSSTVIYTGTATQWNAAPWSAAQRIVNFRLPDNLKRYNALTVTLGAGFNAGVTAGKISAGLALGAQDKNMGNS